jgi:twitching motility protein PilT
MAIQLTSELERALQSAADRKASDLFLLPNEPVAFRVKDQIERSDGAALSPADVRAIAAAAVGEQRLARLVSDGGRIVTSCGLAGVIDGHLCVASSRGEITIVIGLIPAVFVPIDKARIPHAVIRELDKSHGLFVFSGRVGSGKTTTMLSITEHLNRETAKHICTVEDPISVIMTPKKSLVTQREVGVDVPDTVAGIAAAVTQDADLIVVGELKCPEDVQACMTATNVGKMVFTQMHATTPALVIQRLFDVQPAEHLPAFRRQLAQVLRGITAQILLPHAAGEGRRVPAYGVLIPDPEMRRAIADGRDAYDRKNPLPEGCRDITEDIEQLRREGLVTDDAARAALDTLQ